MSAEKSMSNINIGSVRKCYVTCLSVMLLVRNGGVMQPSETQRTYT